MIVVSYGSDAEKTTYDTLAASDIAEYLKPYYQVSLKPNLVVPGPASNGAVTHPQVTEGVIRYLKDFGISNIKIIESSWIGADTLDAYRNCDYLQIYKKYNIPLIDLKKDKYRTINSNDLDIKVCSQSLDTDFLINIPVLKAHCQTHLTCCLKNLKGCIPDDEKRRFHTLGIHKPVAVLNAIIKTGYCVVDGICGDLSFEEGGNPVVANRIIAGRDPVTVDSYCASLIGYTPEEIDYLTYAKFIGVGEYFTQETKIKYIGADNKPLNDIKHTHATKAADRYKHMIVEKDACSACYSSLIYALHRMNNFNKKEKLYIGQGFKGSTISGTGVGTCTQGFSKCIKGCPPTAADIIGGLNG